MEETNFFGVYVHIPFCDSKCSYCDFVSSVCNNSTKKEYFQALQNEIETDAFYLDYFKTKKEKELANSKKLKKRVNSIYIGGGTPSCADVNDIIKIIQVIKKKFDVDLDAEITVECNPCSVSLEKITAYKNAGINRISFGAQSFVDAQLEFLGRRHTSAQIFDAINMSKDAGITNISIDLIVGIWDDLDICLYEKNIKILKEMGVKHFSIYLLSLEKNTPLFQLYKNNEYKLPSEENCLQQFEKLSEILKKNNFSRYEVSNFAQSGFESKHNSNYWRLGAYRGVGVAAHSFFAGKRVVLNKSLNEYIDFAGKFIRRDYGIEKISSDERQLEYIMLGLRLSSGIDLNKIKNENFLERKKDFILQVQTLVLDLLIISIIL